MNSALMIDHRSNIRLNTSTAGDGLPQVVSYLDWMKSRVLPFWAGQGLNAATSLFHERLEKNGSPDLQSTLRIRTQFRQVYVMAHAAELGWFAQGLQIAHACWASLLSRAYRCDGTPGFIHTLSPAGVPADQRRDSYDHAFAVLAAAWLSRASGDVSVERNLQDLLLFADTELSDRHSALKEGLPDKLPYRQNPQMHWFESMLALIETSTHVSGAKRAARHRNFFETKLIDAETGSLAEYFTADWLPVPGQQGETVEPGHHMEWVWLLRRHEALAGLPRSNLPSKILQTASRFVDPVNQLLVDEARRDGSVTRSTRRIWLQTELIKAHLAEYEAGHAAALAEVISGLDRLEHHYLRRPFTQGWIDQLDGEARPIPAAVPASILYHLFVLATELERVLMKPCSKTRQTSV